MSSRKNKKRKEKSKEKSKKKSKTNKTEKLTKLFKKAEKFAKKTHIQDIERIDKRDHLVEKFDEFFKEYIYVVVASGFRGKTAAELLPKLEKCQGNKKKMLKHFKNKRKCEAISTVFQLKNDWENLRSSLTTVDSLKQFPLIGDVVKHHLARNIGLVTCAKPDLHLTRLAKKLKFKDVKSMVDFVASNFNYKPGTADFILWIYLSHNGEEQDCCYGGYELR
ncbi:hypothetical protein M0811_10929 [Anaeramoeba ignava]|uniref:Uncharacterized protein n=1 Tax=Anaeramoeba ignava TaxID=1746090 RepID=A0A9Q0LCP8_ANAIG|nr:hypothetical protein M0811_10929 [Anaeramoeba ignava]